MEKVKVSKEIADSIERLKNIGMDCILEDFLKYRGTWTTFLKPLNTFSVDDLAIAVFVGYEIEETFKPGDKVLNTHEGKQEVLTLAHPVLPKGHVGKAWKIQESLGWLGEEEFRLATPEEIYWLETLGRKKICDFHKGDIFIDGDGDPLLYEGDIEDLAAFPKYYAEGDFKGLYPTESFKPFPKENSNER